MYGGGSRANKLEIQNPARKLVRVWAGPRHVMILV